MVPGTARIPYRWALSLALAVSIAAACTASSAPSPSPSPPASGSPSSSPIASPSPTPAGAQVTLDAAPNSCGAAGFGQISDARGRGLGATPVWAQGFDAAGSGAVLHVPAGAKDFRGVPAPVTWVIVPDFKQQIELRLHAAENSDLLWIGDAYGAARPAVLLAGSPGIMGRVAADGFEEFPGKLFIPRAGCYVLEVRWPGGSWTASFAAGR